jgi:hypothetical protein
VATNHAVNPSTMHQIRSVTQDLLVTVRPL